MSKVLVPGSFDPFTLGHLDVVKRCSATFDKVVVMVGFNSAKKGFLSEQKRIEYINDAVKELDNVEVIAYDGLVVDFAHDNGIDFIVKGIRNENDVEYESQMACVNKNIALEKYGKGIETLYLQAAPEFVHTSSSLVRQLIGMNLSVSKYVHNENLLLRLI
ncbi:MAG: pantetheine-phosphate adenylyltransferase [Clostridia bacterium]|nr:pantetheine-phosphate adenylyltransferase [Clostridia bacterium]